MRSITQNFMRHICSGPKIRSKQVNPNKHVEGTCMVPSMDGKEVVIRKGDHIRLWFKSDVTQSWVSDKTGVVVSVASAGCGEFRVALKSDGLSSNGGNSIFLLRDSDVGYSRVAQILVESGKKSF